MTLSAGSPTPVDSNDVFRWVFTSAGLWLILSPFLMLLDQPIVARAGFGGAETTLTFGIVALLLAGFTYRKNTFLQAAVGIALGLSLAVSPLVVGFTDQATATWNAVLAGVFITLITAIEIAYLLTKRRM